MGNCVSGASIFSSDENIAVWNKWAHSFRLINLSKGDIRRLYKPFHKIEMNHCADGKIELNSFLQSVGISSPYVRRALSIFDFTHTGKMDFRHYTYAIWNFCSLSNAALVAFTFELYKESPKAKFLSVESVLKMLDEIHYVEGHVAQKDM